jgi:hypothetical protein
LAIGTVEDFAGGDLFTLLPKSWFETKLFVNDYSSIVLLVLILSLIPAVSILVITRKVKNGKRSSKNASTVN